MQMTLIKQKNKKLEKQLREVNPLVVKNLLQRYNRFCEDQFLHTFLAFRKKMKILNLNTREMMAFRITINNRRNYDLSNLTPPDDPHFNPDTLGEHIDYLPAFLDPDASKVARLDPKNNAFKNGLDTLKGDLTN